MAQRATGTRRSGSQASGSQASDRVQDAARVRWRPGLARTVRGPHSLQLGSGLAAVVLEGLTASDWRLLALLDRGPSGAELDRAAGRLGVAGARLGDLVRMLGAADALDGSDEADGPWPGPTALAGAQVAVVGGGGLGVALTVALAAAGASRAALVDDATVSAHDVVPGGALHGDVGRRAAHVAAEAVHRLRPDTRTACPSDPDLVVLVSAHVPDAPAGIPLVQAGTLHLPVVVRPAEVVVGPLVVPGRGACLHCVDLHHRDVDPGWADAVRLLRREGRRVRQPGPAPTAVVTGLATLLAGAPGPASRAGVEVRVAAGGATSWHRWTAHPGCGCVGWPDPGPSDDVGAPVRPGRAGPPAPTRRAGATMAA